MGDVFNAIAKKAELQEFFNTLFSKNFDELEITIDPLVFASEILKSISSYEILEIYAEETDNICYFIASYNTAYFFYGNYLFSIFNNALDILEIEMQTIFDKYILKGNKECLIIYFKDKLLKLKAAQSQRTESEYNKPLNNNERDDFLESCIWVYHAFYNGTNYIINKLNYYIDLLTGDDAGKQATPATTPKRVQDNEIQALGLLCLMQKIKKHDEKIITTSGKTTTLPEEYWILTSVEDTKETIDKLKKTGQIEIGDTISFMKNNLKGKTGGDVSNSFRTAKSVKKCKIS